MAAAQIPDSGKQRTHVTCDVPEWVGQSPRQFLEEAGLRVSELPTSRPGIHTLDVQTVENYLRQRPELVTKADVAGAEVQVPQLTQLAAYLADESARPVIKTLKERRETQQRLAARASTGDPAALASSFFLDINTADPGEVPGLLAEINDQMTKGGFAASSAHFINRTSALMNRLELPKVLLRAQQDPNLKAGRIQEAMSARGGENVFTTARGLTDGVGLFDAYMGPLLGCLSPHIWTFYAIRMSGVSILVLDRLIRGLPPEPNNPLDTLPAETWQHESAPTFDASAGRAALAWWTDRLNDLFGWLSDPATFQDQNGMYDPEAHLAYQLNVEQIFRRVGSLQRTYDDPAARRALMFTVMDTLEARLTGRSLLQMTTKSYAERTLRALRQSMSPEAQPILLTGAERAIASLDDLHAGFDIPQGCDGINLYLSNGTTQTVTRDEAGSLYIDMLRNATHGFGWSKSDRKSKGRDSALLVHHTGHIPHELPTLSYLYLLDLLSRPKDIARSVSARVRKRPR